jgi:HK97 family phage prohead protease
MTHALDESRADTKKPYGDVTYADPGYQSDGKARYPLSSEEKCRAAWSYVNMPKNAAMYTSEQLAAIKGRIKAAAKRYGIEISENSRPGLGLCTRAFDFEFDGDGGDGRTLEGYAAVFNKRARIRDLQGDFDEEILQGAFKRTIARRMPVLQFDHGKDPRIGGTPIGKIDALAEDSRGLHVRARLFTHPDVERVREAIAERAISGMSFRFSVGQGGDHWSHRAEDVDLRQIAEVEDAPELGPVVFPAYDQTSVSVRSLLSGLSADETRELVHELAGHLGLAVDLQDLTGQPSARSAGGGDAGTSPGVGRVPSTPSTQQLLDDGTLRLKGILK